MKAFVTKKLVLNSGSGEDVGTDRDSPDIVVGEAGLTSPSVKTPKSPTKGGSGKKKPYATNVTKATRVVHTAKRTLYTAGRPPWYDCQGQLKNAFVIGEWLFFFEYFLMNMFISVKISDVFLLRAWVLT